MRRTNCEWILISSDSQVWELDLINSLNKLVKIISCRVVDLKGQRLLRRRQMLQRHSRWIQICLPRLLLMERRLKKILEIRRHQVPKRKLQEELELHNLAKFNKMCVRREETQNLALIHDNLRRILKAFRKKPQKTKKHMNLKRKPSLPCQLNN